MLVIASTKANTLWSSEQLYRQAASKNKKLQLVDGATYIAMYDKYVP